MIVERAIDRFKTFFKKEGISFEEWKPYIGSTIGSDNIITVAQAHFHFRDGEYLGVEADDMGYFKKKI